MLLGHQPANLETLFGEDGAKLLQALEDGDHSTCVVLPRSNNEGYICSNPQEEEAEVFSALIQNQVIRANRFHYLVNTSTSIEGLKAFTDALGFQE